MCFYSASKRFNPHSHMGSDHIHDEVIIEVEEKKAKENYDRIVEIMSKPPRWAHDLPLRADGYTTPFYKKD